MTTKKQSSQKTSFKLPHLSDFEYTEASKRAGDIPLDECPTCRAKKIEVGPHVYGWENGTYKYHRETHRCDCQTQMLLRKHYLKANIGDQYQRLDWSNYDGDPNLISTVNMYLKRWPNLRINGMGLSIFGSMGSGKTFAATHIGKELIKRGESVYFIHFLEVVSAYQKPNVDEIEFRLKNVPWLIIDELVPPDPGPQTNLFTRRFEELIRHRTNFNLPTIITTNLSENRLSTYYTRTYSVLAPKQIPVEVEADDARLGKIALENIELAKNEEVAPIT